MKSLTDQEYIELCKKLVDEQYDDAVDDYDVKNMEWIPAEPVAKEVMKQKTDGLIDLTNVRSTEIAKQIPLCTNFKVGPFKLRIERYFEYSHDSGNYTISSTTPPKAKKYETKYRMEVWEEKTKTPNGMPCRIDSSFSPKKDNRFAGRAWLKNFGENYASDLSLDVVVDIVRWMQAIKKLTAFL